MKRRHIVLVANDVGGVGGMEKHLEEMINRMKRDYSVTVISSSFRVKDPSGVRFIKIPAIRKPFPLMIAMFSVLASIRLWFMRDSIIHTTGAIVFNRVDASTIHFCHAGYSTATKDNGSNRSSWLYKLNAAVSMRIKLRMERFCYRPSQAGKLIAVSDRIREELETFYLCSSEDIEVIPNGVDIQKFYPRSTEEKQRLRRAKGLTPDGTYLLFMGGDWERKGLRLVLSAFNMLASDYPDLHLMVVGSGDADAFASIVEPTHRDRVQFTGKQSDPELWYGMSDIFVFPSQYEACSLAVLEAAASGLAMVLTDVGGARDVVDNGIGGCIVEPYGAVIARTIGALLNDPGRLNALGKQARMRMESLTWDDTYRKFKAVYDHLSPATVKVPNSKIQIGESESDTLTKGATNHA